MSDVMLAMYLQQSNEKVFVKTYTTDWLADKGNSKINIIESLLSLIFLLVRPLLWKSPQRNDVWWNREILDILPRLPSQYTLHYTICTADNSWETPGLSCFPTLGPAPAPGLLSHPQLADGMWLCRCGQLIPAWLMRPWLCLTWPHPSLVFPSDICYHWQS